MKIPTSGSRPWYREPWPWLLVAPPAASILMGIVMWAAAIRTDDGLVVDDYYRRGLAINRVLERDARAAALGVRGVVAFNPEHTRVRLQLAGAGAPPSRVTLRLVHPTRAGEDQTVSLAASPHGALEGAIRPPAPGRWRVVIEDPVGGWRVSGEWHTREPAAAFEAVLRFPAGG
jgi:hypothetical protein